MALGRESIVGAALAILDEFGMADLSMRRVADALGVKVGALYWHVANKQSLLAAVADRVLADVPAPDVASGPREALSGWATGCRRVLLEHRDSADLVATALASGLCTVDPVHALVPLLPGVGDEPRWGAQAVLHLVLGHVAQEQTARLMGELGVAARSFDEAAFTHGVEALVTGLLQVQDAAVVDAKE